jgi:hypothetical protein
MGGKQQVGSEVEGSLIYYEANIKGTLMKEKHSKEQRKGGI